MPTNERVHNVPHRSSPSFCSACNFSRTTTSRSEASNPARVWNLCTRSSMEPQQRAISCRSICRGQNRGRVVLHPLTSTRNTTYPFIPQHSSSNSHAYLSTTHSVPVYLSLYPLVHVPPTQLHPLTPYPPTRTVLHPRGLATWQKTVNGRKSGTRIGGHRRPHAGPQHKV